MGSRSTVRPGSGADRWFELKSQVHQKLVNSLTPEQRLERSDYAGCIAGALSFAEYRTGLEAVGLTDVSLTITHPVADRMYSVIVKAGKPVVGAGIAAADQRAHPRPEPLTPGSCC